MLHRRDQPVEACSRFQNSCDDPSPYFWPALCLHRSFGRFLLLRHVLLSLEDPKARGVSKIQGICQRCSWLFTAGFSRLPYRKQDTSRSMRLNDFVELTIAKLNKTIGAVAWTLGMKECCCKTQPLARELLSRQYLRTVPRKGATPWFLLGT